jgi:hypothetical protein
MCFSFARQSERVTVPHRLIGRGAPCRPRGGVAGRSPAVKQVEAPACGGVGRVTSLLA